MVSRVIKATATDMSRPVLNGIRFHLLGNGTFDVAATDAFRLHLASGDISYEGEPLDFIWPLESLKTALALFKSGEQSGLLEIKLPQATAKDEQGKATSWRPLQVEADGNRFLTRLVDGLFPNFDAVIPKRRIGSVLLDTVAALQAIKVVEVMARDTGSVTCAVGEAVTDAEGTSFTLSGHSADAGWSENVLTVTADGDPLTFRVAGHFLADALKAAPEPPLLLSYNSAKEPVVLTASAEPDFKAVIMPMHVSR